nr:MAG TPA: hypothetical protein [Caudoviricetes sp.]
MLWYKSSKNITIYGFIVRIGYLHERELRDKYPSILGTYFFIMYSPPNIISLIESSWYTSTCGKGEYIL